MHGCAVRQDGRSASLTAPNGQAQQGLLSTALSNAGTAVDALATAIISVSNKVVNSDNFKKVLAYHRIYTILANNPTEVASSEKRDAEAETPMAQVSRYFASSSRQDVWTKIEAAADIIYPSATYNHSLIGIYILLTFPVAALSMNFFYRNARGSSPESAATGIITNLAATFNDLLQGKRREGGGSIANSEIDSGQSVDQPNLHA